MRPTVYIETTIPSFYFETRKTPDVLAWRLTTRRWWRTMGAAHERCTSEAVIAELVSAPRPKARRMLRILDGLRLLTIGPEVESIAAYYIANRLMPREMQGDAYHLAIASFHRCDYLLTWNLKHLANARKVEHIRVLNQRRQLFVPTICTPYNLFE